MTKTLWLSLCCLTAMACGGGAADVDAAGPGPGDAFQASGPPIVGANGEWTWVPFPTSVCRNGSSTGIGVNLNSASNNVYIHLQGGGACFEAITCSANPLAFSAASFNSWKAGTGTRGVFNRQNADNPFVDYNHVFVPYCTGDIHAGDTLSGAVGEPQRGYYNIGEFLQRIVPTFPDAQMVVLGGSSAGGFGAAYNYDRVHRAFGDTPMRLVDDSGPPLGPAYMTPCFQNMVSDAWGLADTALPGCTDCDPANGGGFHNMAPFLARKYSGEQLGIISSTQDGTIRDFYSFGYPDCQNPDRFNYPADVYEAGVYDLADNIMGPYDNAHMFIISSMSHVWLTNEPLGGTVSGGVPLTDWLRALIDGGAGWQTVRP